VTVKEGFDLGTSTLEEKFVDLSLQLRRSRFHEDDGVPAGVALAPRTSCA
jgi:hypothetical protein